MPASPFEIITPNKNKKSGAKGIIIVFVAVIFLIISIVAGVLLVRQNQNVSEKAASTQCPAAEACPYPQDPTLLRSCHPTNTDGSVVESVCNLKGRIETCGPTLTKYCCPAVGSPWTTNMSACTVSSPTPSSSPSPAVNSNTTSYTASEIATHNTATNCWLIINNNVYNVSTYLVQHPGGVSVVTPYCGKEATQAFNTQGGKGSHSNTAKNLLTTFQVGTLSTSISTTPTPTPTQVASTGTIQCNGSCTTSSQCASGLSCYISSGTTGSCRASLCVTQSSCVCPTTAPTSTPLPTKTPSPAPNATITPSPVPTSTNTSLAYATTTPTSAGIQTTPLPIPETGTSWPTVLGGIFGVLVILGSIILAF